MDRDRAVDADGAVVEVMDTQAWVLISTSSAMPHTGCPQVEPMTMDQEHAAAAIAYR